MKDQKEILKAMDGICEFEIGQIVKTVGSLSDDKRYASWGSNGPVRYIIIERTLQQCHGELLQKRYACRAITQSGDTGKDYIHFVEIELEASEAFKMPEKK